MDTLYVKLDAALPEKEIIKLAAGYLKKSELVAFPTETVYGLGAAAFDSEAVKKIFQAKGRPAQNPLLVHVSNLEQVKSLVDDIPADARLLMDKFWPGPLSIILAASKNVPAIVRGGQSTVGLRMPSHPVALALIEATGPIAAPSANLFGRPSPITAEHVKSDLDGRIALVLDAGPTGMGLESTIIDLTGKNYRILRRGGLPVESLQELLRTKLDIKDADRENSAHYQIPYQLILCQNEEELQAKIIEFLDEKKKVAVVYNSTVKTNNNNIYKEYKLDLEGHNGKHLFSIMRDAEKEKLDVLLLAPLPQHLTGTTAALVDRIHKAAGTKAVE